MVALAYTNPIAVDGNQEYLRQPDIQNVVYSNNTFAMDLLQQLEKTHNQENIVFSPFSIECAFAMLVDGAGGATRKEMINVMHFPGAGDYLQRNLQILRNSLVSMNQANSFWCMDSYQLAPEYLHMVQTYYPDELHRFSQAISPAEKCRQVNQWVQDKTQNRIQNLLPLGSITDENPFILANAVYFKQCWAQTFSSANTHNAAFHLSDGSTCTVAFMCNCGMQLRYRSSETYQAIALPYADRRCTMIVVLPGANKTIGQVLKAISRDGFDSVIPTPQDIVPVNVTIPKFEFTLPTDLHAALMDLGMTTAFTVGADFSRLSYNLSAGSSMDVYHKAFIRVDETGTEAAASTVNRVEGGIQSVTDTVNFTANRPFLFLIRDNVSGTILFIGQVTDPSQK